MKRIQNVRILAVAVALGLVAACADSGPAAPTAVAAVSGTEVASGSGGSGATIAGKPTQTGTPTGERVFGKVAVEPAYNADSGELMYLLTPEKATFPSKANGNATSPLYLVEYPAGSTAAAGGAFNCAGVPGNCPDHDAIVAGVAVNAMPAVYGTNINVIPGHDHVADPPGKPDFNVAWEVIEVLFTPQGVQDGAINRRLTTDAAIDAAVDAGDAIKIDLGFAFNCSVVPASLYWSGTPIS